jgi:curli biogenesis system outer membrane secretion channel CsgG
MKVIVLRLQNMTRKGKKDSGTAEDRLFGNGIRTQIVTALEQTGRFTILENEGQRKVLQSDALTGLGEVRATVWSRLGAMGEAEFLVAGTLLTYQLSQESKNAGIDADPIFRESQARTIEAAGIVDTAKKVFDNLKPKDIDRVEMDLWLFDTKTGKRIALTTIQGTPDDSGGVIGGRFGQQLAAVSGEMKTPMQQALRGGAIKAANWIAERGEGFRLLPPSPPPEKRPVREIRKKRRPTTATGSREPQEEESPPPDEPSVQPEPVPPPPPPPPPEGGVIRPKPRQWGTQ